ncbi:Hypothetical protein PHPALM_5571 [Phytophthora palmivora]|uniref:Uncharacterized protein n=1 Tax=Phytophthora palmivora TaxID=4796 RepID=A0A2P4YH18_9STRA|nr:Hypothetical protein PHPALM_5571 [Phytophthora palmivora]
MVEVEGPPKRPAQTERLLYSLRAWNDLSPLVFIGTSDGTLRSYVADGRAGFLRWHADYKRLFHAILEPRAQHELQTTLLPVQQLVMLSESHVFIQGKKSWVVLNVDSGRVLNMAPDVMQQVNDALEGSVGVCDAWIHQGSTFFSGCSFTGRSC